MSKVTIARLLRGQTALNEYRVVHKDGPGPGKLTEDQVNTLGYWLKGKKRLKEAVEVFKMNTEDFPNSSNAFDSLGEVYMDIGDKAAAIKGYQKSLELNPKNTNAVEMLKKLQN
jgi:tetratricopeptide (TPR) repeat protein